MILNVSKDVNTKFIIKNIFAILHNIKFEEINLYSTIIYAYGACSCSDSHVKICYT